MLWLWSPQAPVLGPLKNMRLLLKPNRTDLLTNISLFVSGAQRCCVRSHSNSLKRPPFTNMRLTEQTDFISLKYLCCVIWNTNLIAFIAFLLSIGPVIQTQLMKPYVRCHLFGWEISARTQHLWGNKVWQSSSKTSIKSVKLYTGGFILIYQCCLKLISLSPSSLFPLLSFSVCACVPVHECVSIAKNINFTNISPRLLNTSNPLCCALSCYGG